MNELSKKIETDDVLKVAVQNKLIISKWETFNLIRSASFVPSTNEMGSFMARFASSVFLIALMDRPS